MLYDDIQQLEVRYVISLEYHEVDIFNGGGFVPEGELWIKRNAIRLRRKPTSAHDQINSLPFFLFSENMSEKEDFYFAVLNNQSKGKPDSPPEAQRFVVKDIVTLVQKLHSSEEHLQTRWLNAIIGRLFLSIYKTPQMEAFIRMKLTKKISRVRKPNFITKLALQKIQTGNGAPFITNPRLRDLTVDGDCTMECDLLYTGNFRIEIAATARIDLGPRLKAREVDLVLAATCKSLEGHLLLRIKPPPSNRFWYTFEKPPKLDLTIEPIISSRQITYTLVTKAIESRIREVMADTVVFPFWDDTPFTQTSEERFRGGIWQQEARSETTTEIRSEDPEDEADATVDSTHSANNTLPLDERTMSTPALNETGSLRARSSKRSTPPLAETFATTTSSEKASTVDAPRLMRSSSFATVTDPQLSANTAQALNSPQKDASSVLKDLSARSLSGTPSGSPTGTPTRETSLAAAMQGRGIGLSQGSSESLRGAHARQSSGSTFSLETPEDDLERPASSESIGNSESVQSDLPARKKGFVSAAKALNTAEGKQQALASINAATLAAQKWGWGVLQKKKQREAQEAEGAQVPTPMPAPEPPVKPMGRGRPLPPPGIPLPPPERSSTLLNFNVAKRKPVPPPLLPRRPEGVNGHGPAKSPKPPLPERRRRQSAMLSEEDPGDEEIMIVEAPTESAPSSPVEERGDALSSHETANTEEVKISQATPVQPESEAGLHEVDHADIPAADDTGSVVGVAEVADHTAKDVGAS